MNMNMQLKQRIIGIVVIVGFVALLIPFLFVGSKKPATTADVELPLTMQEIPVGQQLTPNGNEVTIDGATQMPISVVNNAAPVITQSTDGSVVITPPAAGQQLPVVATQQQDQQVLVQPAAISVVNPVEVSPVLNNSIVDVDNQLSENAPVISSPEYPATQQVVVAQEKAETTVAAPVAKKALAKVVKSKKLAAKKKVAINLDSTIAPPMLKGYWTVQAGSFADAARAEKLIKDLRKGGYKSYTQQVGTLKGTLTRVLVGREETKAKAESIAKTLKSILEINTAVIKM